MISSPILDDNQMPFGLIKNILKESFIAFGIKPSCMSLVEESSAEIVYQTKNLIRFALTTSFNYWLFSFWSPGIGSARTEQNSLRHQKGSWHFSQQPTSQGEAMSLPCTLFVLLLHLRCGLKQNELF